VIKQLLSILTNIKAEEVGYIEADFLLNINELQVFHASFGDEPGPSSFDDYLREKT